MEKIEEKFKKIFDQYCDIVGQDTKGTQIGIYSVALIGFGIAVRRVRPFSKFRNPLDIPKRFIKEGRELNGFVERIEPNGAILMVQHKPLLPFIGQTRDPLPVKIAGVKTNGHGVSWLQSIVAGNDISFIPVYKESNCLQCEVILPQIQQKIVKNKIKNQTRKINVGEALLMIGFGEFQPFKTTTLEHIGYTNQLKFAEDLALRKQLGLRYYVKPTKLILMALVERLRRLAEKIVKKQYKKKMEKIALT